MTILFSTLLYAINSMLLLIFFFFNDTATTEIYTLSLHDALPICCDSYCWKRLAELEPCARVAVGHAKIAASSRTGTLRDLCVDRKSTRLNSSHSQISYAVFCLKKKKKKKFIKSVR